MSGRWTSRDTRVKFGRLTYVRQGAARFDLSDPYAFALGLGWGEFALLFVVLELSLNALFGVMSWAVPGCIANMPAGSYVDAFFFSVETLATVGYGVMAPVTPYGHAISGVEIISGTAFTAIMTGLTFVRFSRARPRILYSDKMVVARHNGVPTLMLRLANARAGLVTNARAQLTVLLPEQTEEGQTFRRIHELHLLRSEVLLFAITWTVMHPIVPDSPLYGLGLEELVRLRARFFFSVQAWDVRLGAEIRDLHDYGVDEILFGSRFVDVVTFDNTSVPTADFARLSDVTADTAWDATTDSPTAAHPNAETAYGESARIAGELE